MTINQSDYEWQFFFYHSVNYSIQLFIFYLSLFDIIDFLMCKFVNTFFFLIHFFLFHHHLRLLFTKIKVKSLFYQQVDFLFQVLFCQRYLNLYCLILWSIWFLKIIFDLMKVLFQTVISLVLMVSRFEPEDALVTKIWVRQLLHLIIFFLGLILVVY